MILAAKARQITSRYRAGRQPGHQRLVGKTGARGESHQPAVRLHEEKLRCCHAMRGELVGKPQQVSLNDRTDVGIDNRR